MKSNRAARDPLRTAGETVLCRSIVANSEISRRARDPVFHARLGPTVNALRFVETVALALPIFHTAISLRSILGDGTKAILDGGYCWGGRPRRLRAVTSQQQRTSLKVCLCVGLHPHVFRPKLRKYPLLSAGHNLTPVSACWFKNLQSGAPENLKISVFNLP
jgi:hypothetical protein